MELQDNGNEIVMGSMLVCPDGHALYSFHRHDYVEHTQEDGREYILDGGDAYIRSGGSDRSYTVRQLTLPEDFHLLRNKMTWGSYGKNGDKPLTRRSISKLTTDHLNNLMTYFDNIEEATGVRPKIAYLMAVELEYRKTHNVEVEDYD